LPIAVPALPRQQASRELGISESTLRRWCEHEGAPIARRGRKGNRGAALYDVAAIQAWREQRRQGPSKTNEVNTSAQLIADLPQIISDALDEQFLKTTGPHKLQLAAEFTGVWYRLLKVLEKRGIADVPMPAKIERLRLIAHRMSD
jgi:hypothetical protein